LLSRHTKIIPSR